MPANAATFSDLCVMNAAFTVYTHKLAITEHFLKTQRYGSTAVLYTGWPKSKPLSRIVIKSY